MRILITSVFLLLLTATYSQQVRILHPDRPEVNFSGLSVVDNYVFWVSGSHGTIGMTPNGGKTFIWTNPPGREDRNFHLIHAFNFKTVLAVAEGSPELVLVTSDSGRIWREVREGENMFILLPEFEIPGTNSYSVEVSLITKFVEDQQLPNIVSVDESEKISCGPEGVVFSDDWGENWKKISNTPFNTCQKAAIGHTIYFAGPNGAIGSLLNR